AGARFPPWHATVAYYNATPARPELPRMDAEWERRAPFLAASSVIEEMFGHDETLLGKALGTARTIDYEPFYALMEPVPGLFEVLASLRPAWRLGMATNRGSTVPGVVRRFGLDAWLDAAVGALDAAGPKPHPDVILECLAGLAVAPAAAVYVGDAESDAAAAAAAGVHFIAVGEHTSSARVVRDLREVPAVLDALGR